MATQNPIESEGTYPLPEAQVDRFMLKVLIDYPTPTEEFVIVERMTAAHEPAGRAIDAAQLAGLQRAADAVFVDPALIEYAVKLANATRDISAVGLGDLSRYITFGASPRASINMILAGRALALVRGREYALPQDLQEIAPDVLRHRLVLSYEALADGVTPDDDHRPHPRGRARFPSSRCRERMPPTARARPERDMDTARTLSTARRDARASSSTASSGRSSAASTACCRGTTARSSAGSARTSSTSASTSRVTTSATSTGTSPRGWTRRSSGSTPRIAS